MNNKNMAKSVDEARLKWLEASSKASELALEMYQPGSGYGDPQAEAGDKYRVEVAKSEADKLMHQYHDIDRKLAEKKFGELQKSQTIATWASFTVAFVVGATTIISIILPLMK